jgi:ribosomal protein S18 acetylase RimI-like enzyme
MAVIMLGEMTASLAYQPASATLDEIFTITFGDVGEDQRTLWYKLHSTAYEDVFSYQYGPAAAAAECLMMAATMWDNCREHCRWIYKGEILAGAVVVQEVHGIYFVLNFFLLPHLQGMGLGKAVVSQLQKEAKDLGLAILLEVFPTNTRALAFYRGLGFWQAGERAPHHIQMVWGTLD